MQVAEAAREVDDHLSALAHGDAGDVDHGDRRVA
jgi:hypothetical protein